MSFIGYARVSTDDQTTRQQIDALQAAGCTEVFEDTISDASTQRDGLDACLAALETGDALVVVALDRLGRSMAHLVSTVHELADRGVGFRSLRSWLHTGQRVQKVSDFSFPAAGRNGQTRFGAATRTRRRCESIWLQSESRGVSIQRLLRLQLTRQLGWEQ